MPKIGVKRKRGNLAGNTKSSNFMQIMEYIEILKWPVVALVAIWIFRKPIKELILNIADFSITKDGLSARIAKPSAKISNNKVTEVVKSDNPSEGYVLENKEGEVFFDYSNNNGRLYHWKRRLSV